jgi:hypothetical protein
VARRSAFIYWRKVEIHDTPSGICTNLLPTLLLPTIDGMSRHRADINPSAVQIQISQRPMFFFLQFIQFQGHQQTLQNKSSCGSRLLAASKDPRLAANNATKGLAVSSYILAASDDNKLGLSEGLEPGLN